MPETYNIAIAFTSLPDLEDTVAGICKYSRPPYSPTIANPEHDPEDEESPEEIANPETPAQFANRMVREKFLAPHCRRYRKDRDSVIAEGSDPEIIDPQVVE